jgi:hypothetical protein
VQAELEARDQPWLARLLATPTLVEDLGPGLGRPAHRSARPQPRSSRISPFGQTGPLAGSAATTASPRPSPASSS